MQSVMREDAFALQIGKNSACRGLLYRRAKPKAWHHPNRNAETRFNRVSNLFGGRKTFIPSPIDNFGIQQHRVGRCGDAIVSELLLRNL
jgi:hypothetical protein